MYISTLPKSVQIYTHIRRGMHTGGYRYNNGAAALCFFFFHVRAKKKPYARGRPLPGGSLEIGHIRALARELFEIRGPRPSG